MEPLTGPSILILYRAVQILDIRCFVIHDLPIGIFTHYAVLAQRAVVDQMARMQRIIAVIYRLPYRILLRAEDLGVRLFGGQPVDRILGKTALRSLDVEIAAANMADFAGYISIGDSFLLKEAKAVRGTRACSWIKHTLAGITRC